MPFLVTAQVHAEMRFRELGALVELRINHALVEGAAIALEAVKAAETRETDESPASGFYTRKVFPGVHLRDTFQPAIVKRFVGHMGVSSSDIVIWSPNPNAIWQELGTRSRRRKGYKASTGKPNNVFPFRTYPDETGNRGVPPLYYMRKGLRLSAPKVAALIARAVAGVGEYGGGVTTVVDTTSTRNPARTAGVSPRPF